MNGTSPRPVLPRIPVNKPVNANLNTRASSAIFERVNPIQVNLDHLYAHTWSVSRGLHHSPPGEALWLCGLPLEPSGAEGIRL